MIEALEMLGPAIAAVLGAVTGSFANVVIHRLPRGESIVSPASHCPQCGRPVRWHDNVPLLGYTLLGGRCRDCGARISPRYPAVEVLTALLFLGVWLHTGGDIRGFLAGALFVTALVIGTGIDLEHRLLPDRVTLPLLVAGIALSLLPGDLTLTASLAGMVGGGVLMYVIAEVGDRVYRQPTMGGGDIKLVAALGAWLGLKMLAVALFAAFFLGALGGLIYMGLGGRDKTVPFGPFLAGGALVAYFAGGTILQWYMGFFA